MTFKRFDTYETQRDYAVNKLLKSRNKLTQFAGRIALTAPLPPNINATPSDKYDGGIQTAALWSFVGTMHSDTHKNERLVRHALTIVEVGERAGQLSLLAMFDEMERDDHRKLRLRKSAWGNAEITSVEGLSNRKEKNEFIEGFVEDMELRVLKYDIPLSAQMDQSVLDYEFHEYGANDKYAMYLKRLSNYYGQGIKNSIQEHRHQFGIPESGDPTI